MRRKDREIKDMAEIMEIVRRGNVCNVAFHDEPCPYLIPLNYGARMEDGKLVLYFHGAAVGTKLDRIRENPNVAYSIFGGNQIQLYQDTACKSTTSFESVCGSGRAEILNTLDKKKDGLAVLMNHIGAAEGAAFDVTAFPDQMVQAIAVWRIVTESVTGKRHE